MEKNNQIKVEYMMRKEPWIDTRLRTEEMDFLWNACSGPEPKTNWKGNLVGNISRSELIIDSKDNWFYETALKKLSERLFYRDWDAYYKYHVEKEEPPPKFKLNDLWVNYMKQHEFFPSHTHMDGNGFSFVVFMKIPTHWKEQHKNIRGGSVSDFQFEWTEKDSDVVQTRNIKLCSEDEGRMLFFPASIQHQVYPFYECEEERVTISGNIVRKEKKQYVPPISGYEEKKTMLKMLEGHVNMIKKELYDENTYREVDSFLKKEGEKAVKKRNNERETMKEE